MKRLSILFLISILLAGCSTIMPTAPRDDRTIWGVPIDRPKTDNDNQVLSYDKTGHIHWTPKAGVQLLNFKGFWIKQELPEGGEPGDYYISRVDSPKFKTSDFLVRGLEKWEVFSFRGTQGPKGLDGKDGKDGKDGRGITNITAKPNDEDPYAIDITFTYTDSSTVTITTPNLRGEKGADGKDGKDGKDGAPGKDGRVYEITSKDGSVEINSADPARPDLSVHSGGGGIKKLQGCSKDEIWIKHTDSDISTTFEKFEFWWKEGSGDIYFRAPVVSELNPLVKYGLISYEDFLIILDKYTKSEINKLLEKKAAQAELDKTNSNVKTNSDNITTLGQKVLDNTNNIEANKKGIADNKSSINTLSEKVKSNTQELTKKINDATHDGKVKGRKDGAWVDIESQGGDGGVRVTIVHTEKHINASKAQPKNIYINLVAWQENRYILQPDISAELDGEYIDLVAGDDKDYTYKYNLTDKVGIATFYTDCTNVQILIPFLNSKKVRESQSSGEFYSIVRDLDGNNPNGEWGQGLVLTMTHKAEPHYKYIISYNINGEIQNRYPRTGEYSYEIRTKDNFLSNSGSFTITANQRYDLTINDACSCFVSSEGNNDAPLDKFVMDIQNPNNDKIFYGKDIPFINTERTNIMHFTNEQVKSYLNVNGSPPVVCRIWDITKDPNKTGTPFKTITGLNLKIGDHIKINF